MKSSSASEQLLSSFEQLRSLLPAPDSLVTDLTGQDAYFHDATDYSEPPAAILFARDKYDVAVAMKFCSSHGIPVTPRGAGTGLSGGCVASSNSLLISTERLVTIDIRADTRIAFCGPGVITKDLQGAAATHGLTYPPDPASYTESTLGGNVAENAGGLRCRRYGVTKDYVLGLEAVTFEGGVVRSGIYNDHRGFSLGDILVASEGTLAIITEIALQLIPTPARGTTILVAFDRPQDAGQTVSDINSSGIITTVLEFLDGDAAACSNQYEQNDGLDNVAGLLLIETSAEGGTQQTDAILHICRANHCSHIRIEPDPDKAEELWKVRRNLSKAVKQVSKIRVSEDVAVPNSKFGTLVDFVAQMNAASPLRINAFGHAGDGNLHVNFLSSTGSAQDAALIEEAVLQLMKRTIELGGTLTGEHGIGLAKRRFLSLEFDPQTLHAMRLIKESFDPQGLLNPHKLLPDKK